MDTAQLSRQGSSAKPPLQSCDCSLGVGVGAPLWASLHDAHEAAVVHEALLGAA
eukprot:CAMPEP_0178406626 /NCGR_PEP_ID=MMETSP0689_2-20121128/19008_1 /TAXON_ID=160604 /ORGANISM="Amphidinium massartii, Strain CS-259" /LENGTH=53 /DNA_ID=CAMNT_0020027671 /DNA_START=125 /DNA_END=283 /DNA_ORIENTATION=+